MTSLSLLAGRTVLIALSNNEVSDESAHIHRLARALAPRIHKVYAYKLLVYTNYEWKLGSKCRPQAPMYHLTSAWSLISGFALIRQGRIQDFWKRVTIYKGVGVRSADIISIFLNIPWKWNNLVSLRPNYFIFIWYLKTGVRMGLERTPWTPSRSATVRWAQKSQAWLKK